MWAFVERLRQLIFHPCLVFLLLLPVMVWQIPPLGLRGLSIDGGTRHVFDVKSPQYRAPLSDSPCIISIPKYGPERELHEDDNYVRLKVVGKLSSGLTTVRMAFSSGR